MMAVSSSLSGALVLGALVGGASGASYTVALKDQTVWTVGLGVSYPDMSITKGETLKFISSAHHDVVLLHAPSSGTHWDQCGPTGIVQGHSTSIFGSGDFFSATSPLVEKHYTPPSCGDFYIACSVSQHCMVMQRVKVTVANADGSACAAPCVGAACVTADSKLPVAASGVLRDVKPAAKAKFWGQAAYDTLTVNIGDSVLFNTFAGGHDVATVPTAAALDGCDMSGVTVLADWTYGTTDPSSSCASTSTCCTGMSCGSSGYAVTYNFTATTAGDTYFVCSMGAGGHCKEGQKFRLTVNPASLSSDGNSASSAGRFEVYKSLPLVVLSVLVSFSA